jgi:acyl-CoA reductase-like NAD-dependent aldehyde dehydrogenase
MSRFQVISPVDNSVYLERESATDDQIEKALSLSKRMKRFWRNTALEDRIQICRKAVEYMVDKGDQLGEEITWQMGRPIKYSPLEITNGFLERATHMIGIAPDALADVEVPEVPGFHKFIRREPLGTVFVLAPWNYPYLTSINSILPALIAGNCVILKHAKQTPLCAERYKEAFDYVGLPEGIFQYLHLDHDQVSGIINDQRISYVAFTGSVDGGKAIQTAVNDRFISTGLELGGKDPAYVRGDADLNYTIENLVDGAFFNSGQSCCGIERIYVHGTIYDDFVNGFVEKVKKYRLDNPTLPDADLGPLVRTSAAKFVQNQITQAVNMGAEAHIDAKHFPKADGVSPYLAPQVLTDVTHEMDIMVEETFGPVVGIMKVKDDAHGVRMMNDSKFGLTASIWTKDLECGIALGDDTKTGTFFINRCDYLDPSLAWSGIRHSGKGITLSSLGYGPLTRTKSFHAKEV